MRVITLLLVFVCLVPITGLANDVTVGCGGLSGFNYPSVTMALNGLRGISNRNHTITISGTCVERVEVTDFENVSLIGTPGATITNPGGPAVRVEFSKNITLRDLVIHGVIGYPVIRVSDSSVDIRGGTVEGGGNGVEANPNSRINIYGSTIQDNEQNGVSASGNSSVGIRPRSGQKVVIQHNGTGVWATDGSSVTIWETDVLDNVLCGVKAAGGHVEFGGNGQTRIANSGNGVVANRGGTVVQLGGFVLVDNNRQVGVTSRLGSSIVLMNAAIDNNGDPNSTLPFTAGVAVEVSATAFFSHVTISNSPVTGLLVRDNASVILTGSTITGNGADGIRVETLSGVRFQIMPTTVTGNSGSDLVCGSDTYVVGGSFANVGKDKCPQFKK